MTNATWKQHPGSGDFNDGGNWSGNTVPDGVATFGASNVHAVTFSADTTVKAWMLNTAAGAYSFLVDADHELIFDGAGIVVQHGSATVTATDDGSLAFDGSSSAGKAHFVLADGELTFDESSSAGSGKITADAGGEVHFDQSSKAGSATIIINSGADMIFADSSSAGSATITNTEEIDFFGSSSAGSATIGNNSGGTLEFNETTSAGHATIENAGELDFDGTGSAGQAKIKNAATIDFRDTSSAAKSHLTIEDGAHLTFDDHSHAGSAKIDNFGEASFFEKNSSADSATINNSGFVGFGDMSSAGSATINNHSNLTFADGSSAGNAVITIFKGAFLDFENQSTGGDAKLINKAGGTVDFSFSDGPGADSVVSAGSIQGAGTYDLGKDELTLTSNRSTKVSGLIADGGGADPGATGASIEKQGTGTLTLAHAIEAGETAYSGGTILNDGTLNIAALGAAGTGDITFDISSTGKQTLKIENAALSHHVFDNIIRDFDVQDKIDLAGLAFAPHAHVHVDDLGGSVFEVEVTSRGVTDTLVLANVAPSLFLLGDPTFKLKSDGHGGTDLMLPPPPAEKPDGEVSAESDSSGGFRLDAQQDVGHHDFILG